VYNPVTYTSDFNKNSIEVKIETEEFRFKLAAIFLILMKIQYIFYIPSYLN